MYTNPTRLHSKPTRIKSTGTEVGQALFGETLADLHEVAQRPPTASGAGLARSFPPSSSSGRVGR